MNVTKEKLDDLALSILGDGDRPFIKLKGYSEGENYNEAKKPIGATWTYVTDSEAAGWLNKKGWLGFPVTSGFILIDIDDKVSGQRIFKGLRDKGTRFIGIETPNGYQFFFRDTGKIKTQTVKMITLGGFICDYRLAGKGYTVWPTENTQGRKFIYIDNKLDPLPSLFLPVRQYRPTDKEKLLPIPVNEGIRDDTLFRHACRMRSWNEQYHIGIAETELLKVLDDVNVIFCEPPLRNQEVWGKIKSAVRYESTIKDKEEQDSKKTTPKITAYFQGLVDLVEDSGKIVFLIKEGDTFVTIHEKEIDGKQYVTPDRDKIPYELPQLEGVLTYYRSDNERRLLEDLLTYLKRFSYLPDNLWLIVACNILLSYIQDHADIHYLPYILFFAVPERGKSRTGKAVIYASYRGVYICDLREANLFRYSQDLKATLFLDLKDLWKKAERNNAEDILLQRYEKGAKVSRVLYPERGAFKDMVHYEIYGSTVIATNEPVHKILDTRCIPIFMPNKPGIYENPTPEKGQKVKERLTAWRARVIDKPLPEIEHIGGINGRLWDISKPLLQVCKLVYPEKLETLIDTLLDIAGQRLEDKKQSIEGQIVSAINDLSPEEANIYEWDLSTKEVKKELDKDRPEDHKLTPQYLGRKLKSMGIKTQLIHGYSQILLNRDDFNVLLMQYGFKEPPTLEKTLPNSTKLKEQGISTVYAGRELKVEKETLPTQSLDNSQSLKEVESGRELYGVGRGDGKKQVIDLESEEDLEIII